jgi:hypothetical protein
MATSCDRLPGTRPPKVPHMGSSKASLVQCDIAEDEDGLRSEDDEISRLARPVGFLRAAILLPRGQAAGRGGGPEDTKSPRPSGAFLWSE